MKTALERGLTEMGVPLTDGTLEKLALFGQRLLEKNQVMNLTAITLPQEVVGLHFLDSAAILPYLPEPGTRPLSLLDVGTGAGFPGVPLQILRPDLQVTLLDSLDKRLIWLEEMAEELDLPTMTTVHGRGEDLGRLPEHRESYDLVSSRAVAELRILAELTLPFVAVGGRFIAMKSCDCDEEIQQASSILEALGGKVSSVVDYNIPEMELCHRLVMVEKIAPTPPQYPRRWAKIKK